ncbi:hypothetical protein CSUI_001669, partial [Cystoisospora suis]
RGKTLFSCYESDFSVRIGSFSQLGISPQSVSIRPVSRFCPGRKVVFQRLVCASRVTPTIPCGPSRTYFERCSASRFFSFLKIPGGCLNGRRGYITTRRGRKDRSPGSSEPRVSNQSECCLFLWGGPSYTHCPRMDRSSALSGETCFLRQGCFPWGASCFYSSDVVPAGP